MTRNRSDIVAESMAMFEMALSIGRMSEDTVQERSQKFLRLMLARRNLSFAAIWVQSKVLYPEYEDSDTIELVAAIPKSQAKRRIIAAGHASILGLGERHSIVTDLAARDTDDSELERRFDRGKILTVELPNIGFMRLHSTKPSAFSPREINQLVPVFEIFSLSLQSAFARLQLEQSEQYYRKARDEAEKTRTAAEVANQAKTDFLAMISHEIRTPMTGIMGFADALLEQNVSADGKHMIGNIKDLTRSLVRILNDVLDFSKLEAGKMVIDHRDFRLSDLMQDVVSIYGKNSKPGVNVSLSVADGFPNNVNSDPDRLRQVLTNLMSNAVKFTEHGQVLLNARAAESNDGERVLRFEVSDTGIGMNNETLDQLFQDYSQANTSITREYEGTGLGLAICKRLVELMDGEIGVNSTVGVGSSFWFTIPYTPASSKELESEKTNDTTEATTSAPRSLHILVAEDNNINQMIIGNVLETFGYTFEIVSDGAEAVEAHTDRSYDLVLMDVRMPKMSGLEATRSIRNMNASKASIPIVALTADVVEETKNECFSAGMNAVATKPIDRNELATAITNAVREN